MIAISKIPNMPIKFLRRSFARRKLSRNKKKPGSLYSTTRGALMCSRIMGFLPLSGLTNQTSDKLRYTLWSPYTIYYAFSIFGQILMCLVAVYQVFQMGLQLSYLSNAVFYVSNLISVLILAKTSHSWPLLIKTIEELENQLPYFRRNFGNTINLTTAFMIALAAMEHVFFLSHGFIIAYSCDSDNVIENYLKLYKPWVFNFTEGTTLTWVVTEIFTLQGSFNFNYHDMLIVLISLYLTEYFLIHNERLKKAVQQEIFFCEKFRSEYLKIVHIVKLINVWFGIPLLTSVSANLFTICAQLFYVIRDSNTYLGRSYVCKGYQKDLTFLLDVNRHIYFIFSLFYLIMRTALVLVLSARVYTNGSVTVYTLYELPTSKFSTEVQRYISMIKDIKIAMSGYGFFDVTRCMILTVFGTIVTYEVILLQYYKSNNWI